MLAAERDGSTTCVAGEDSQFTHVCMCVVMCCVLCTRTNCGGWGRHVLAAERNGRSARAPGEK